MTTEHLMILEPSDIRALRLTCRKCQASVSLKLDQTISMPTVCPSCRAEWIDTFKTDVTEAANTFENLASALKMWARAEKDLSPRFRIGFEFQAAPKS